MFSSFQEVVDDGQFTGNATFDRSVGGTPPTTPTTSAQNPPPQIPKWGQTLNDRVTKIEQTMATKAEMQQGFAELKQTMATKAEMQQGFAELKQLIQR